EAVHSDRDDATNAFLLAISPPRTAKYGGTKRNFRSTPHFYAGDGVLCPKFRNDQEAVLERRGRASRVARNSALDLVLASLLINASVYSGESDIERRSIHSFSNSSLDRSNSSRRVPERRMSMAGKILRSANRRSRCTSRFPVPLNSS